MADRKERNERDESPRNRARQGDNAAREIGEAGESTAGHPVGGQSARGSDTEMPEHMPPSTDREEHWQKDRKGQAQSPRELHLDQPEKKKEGHR